MTATVSIKHEGPDTVKLAVHSIDTNSGDITAEHILEAGQGTMIAVHSGMDIVVGEHSEIEKTPAPENNTLDENETPPEAA
ncbi:MAG: hypothetical protein ACYC3F_17205 [Gemmatimonadaceae bacterium]